MDNSLSDPSIVPPFPSPAPIPGPAASPWEAMREKTYRPGAAAVHAGEAPAPGATVNVAPAPAPTPPAVTATAVDGVDRVLALIPDAVLVPLRPGGKAPALKGWQKLTQADMTPDNLDALRTSNFGVVLGAASGGVCSIDIDQDEELEPFLALNPKLENTLRTKRKRGANLWARFRGEYPKSYKLKDASGTPWGEWRADGNQTAIHGEVMDASKGETVPTRYRTLVEAPPLEIEFAEIIWPPGLRLPWLPEAAAPWAAAGEGGVEDEGEPSERNETEDFGVDAHAALVALHGQPFAVSPRGAVALNSMFFVGSYANEHDVLFEPAEGGFYAYAEARGIWQPQTAATIKVELAADLKLFADAQDEVGPQIVNARTDHFLGGLVNLLQGSVENREPFQRPSGVIHAANGMLHLGQGGSPELRPFSADYYSRNVCPVAYQPGADCPRFRAELLENALEADDVSLVQRYAGSLLLGRNLAQKILALSGTAGGGKSTLVEILEKIIGVENVAQLRTEYLAERFEIARFIGKTLLTGKDVPGRFLEERGAHGLKALVGHDLLTAERKGSNGDFQVRGDFGVIITCNSRLRVKLDGDTEAWRRRLLLVRYERPTPARPERGFADKLIAAEGPGILGWMIEGAQAHLAELEQTGDYRMTARQRRRVDALLAESDSVREFVRRGVEPSVGADVTVQELVEGYASYCDTMGWEPLTNRRVENELGDAMQEIHRVARRNNIQRGGKERRGFANVWVKALDAADDDDA